MSNDSGGSKKNKPNDANHVDAETKLKQKRMSENSNEGRNRGEKYKGEIQ